MTSGQAKFEKLTFHVERVLAGEQGLQQGVVFRPRLLSLFILSIQKGCSPECRSSAPDGGFLGPRLQSTAVLHPLC